MADNPSEIKHVFTNLGGLEHILSINTIPNVSNYQSNIGHHSSVQFINLLKQLTQHNKEILKHSIYNELHSMYKVFFNVLHTDVLDGLISMVDMLSNHLQQIIENKEKLIGYLYNPHLGGHIAVDISYHQYVNDFHPIILSNITELSRTLKDFEWINKFSIRNTELHQTLESILSTLAFLQNHCHSLSESRDLMSELKRVKNKNNL